MIVAQPGLVTTDLQASRSGPRVLATATCRSRAVPDDGSGVTPRFGSDAALKVGLCQPRPLSTTWATHGDYIMPTWRAPSLVCLVLIMVQGCGSGERSAPKSEPDKKRSEQPYLYLNAEYERFLIAARTASWKPPMKKEDLKFEALDTKQAADGKWS